MRMSQISLSELLNFRVTCSEMRLNGARETSRSATNGRRMTKPPKKKVTMSGMKPSIPNIAERGILTGRTAIRGSVALSTGLLSNVSLSHPTASNVFGIGSEHPFANYWTCEGGLPEVIGVLPEKLQADILLSQYYECVDPVYPIIDRHNFYLEYEHFWSLRDPEKTDAAFVGLLFTMMALGTQFVSTTNPKDRKQTSEFYASAGNQALRMFSYLNTASLHSVQAMVLVGYFLINDNHASDGWAFSGLLCECSSDSTTAFYAPTRAVLLFMIRLRCHLLIQQCLLYEELHRHTPRMGNR